ncbi:MAG: hypothetical protein ABIJ34_01040 [archaeon]
MADEPWSMYANVSLAPDIMRRTYAGSVAPYHSGALFDPHAMPYTPIDLLFRGDVNAYLRKSFSPDASVPGKSNVAKSEYAATQFGREVFVPVKPSVLDRLK